jgi:hypothetical protein
MDSCQMSVWFPVQSLGSQRVLPCVIPRFTPTCSAELLHGLGALAVQEGCRVQSHISESAEQVCWVVTARGCRTGWVWTARQWQFTQGHGRGSEYHAPVETWPTIFCYIPEGSNACCMKLASPPGVTEMLVLAAPHVLCLRND